MTQFVHIAGDPMLDLVNTVEHRLAEEQRMEGLADYGRVLTWCRETSLLSTDEARELQALAAADSFGADRERFLVLEARESAYRALFEGDRASAAHLSVMYRDALAGAQLRATDTSWAWADPSLTLATPRRRIVRGLVDLLRRDDLDRLDQCEDAVCGRVYFDTSPRRNRRWCITKECGDRNRSRAYYARHHAKQR